MCGRYSLGTSLDDLVETFEVAELAMDAFEPRYNVAPTQEVPILVLGGAGLRLGPLRWGLVPFWADDPAVGSRMINARSETVATSPAFREPFRRRRCLVPADGFYEWRASPGSTGRSRAPKTPFWIHRPDRRPFTFAGIWDRWRPRGDSQPLLTFSILTTDASAFLRPIHDRMPVVVPESARRTWLDPEADEDELRALTVAAPESYFRAHAVSRLVNSPDNDDPALVAEVPDDPDPDPTLDLFGGAGGEA